MNIKVLLVDDHDIMRQGVCALLKRHPNIEIAGQASDGRKAVQSVLELQPDVVIMDIGMPNLNGIEATRQMMAECKNVKVIALSTHSDGAMVSKMLQAGAVGYILKESTFDELLEGITAVVENRHYLCTKTSKIVFSNYVNMLTNPNWSSSDGLSAREREVLQLVAEGKTTREIAQTLNLSIKTVDSHREHIMNKLNIHNIAGLTKYALREGMTIL